MSESIRTLLICATEQLTASSDTALLDAEVLLCHCLDKNRSFLRAWPELQLSLEQCTQYRTLIAQRLHGFPVAYLTGQREFWSRTFRVNRNVLIPRPESELLIELSLKHLPQRKPCKIIDLGTGSGILAITLASEINFADVLATDISTEAICMARQNATRLNTENVRFLESNWFAEVQERDFDLIISNPPYIAVNDPHLQQGDVRYEPSTALISAENGLKDIRVIAEQTPGHLKICGHLLIEHGYNQQADVQAIFKALNYRNVTTHSDLSGQPRVTSGLWKPL